MSVEKLITENIDIWSSSLKTKSASGRGNGKKLEFYGVKKLRELILELAVCGKLVQQQHDYDEPAHLLIERLFREKERLVKDEGLKTRASIEFSEEDQFLRIPKSWGTVRLGNLAKFIDYRGKTPTKIDSGVRLITAKNVKFGYISLEPQEFISEDEYETWMTRGFPKKGDLLFTPEAPLGNIAIIDLKEKFALAQRAICIQCHLSEMSDYLKILMMSPPFQKLLVQKATGTTAKGIKASVLKEILISLPPVEEQQRIVTKVDELMALCDQLEQQTESSIDTHKTLVEVLLTTLTNSTDTDELVQNWARVSEHFDTLFTTEHSIVQLKRTVLQLAMMGKLVDFGNFEVKTIKQLLCFGPRNGFSPKEAPTPTNCKVLKLGATSYGYLDLEQSKFVDVEVESESHLWLKEGDILVQRGNSATFVGSNVIVDKDYSGYIYPDLMMKLRTNDLIVPEYLSLALSSSSSRESMWSQMTGTSGTMPKISKKVVEGVSIPVPADKQVQIEIVKEVNRIYLIIDSLRLKLKQSHMTQIYLADAFVAELL